MGYGQAVPAGYLEIQGLMQIGLGSRAPEACDRASLLTFQLDRNSCQEVQTRRLNVFKFAEHGQVVLT